MYVRNDAATFWYCSTKCRKNATELKRDPRKLKWSRVGPKAFKPVQQQQPKQKMEVAPVKASAVAETTVPRKKAA